MSNDRLIELISDLLKETYEMTLLEKYKKYLDKIFNLSNIFKTGLIKETQLYGELSLYFI